MSDPRDLRALRGRYVVIESAEGGAAGVLVDVADLDGDGALWVVLDWGYALRVDADDEYTVTVD